MLRSKDAQMAYVQAARNQEFKPVPDKLLAVQEARADVCMSESAPRVTPEDMNDRKRRLDMRQQFLTERKEQHNVSLDEYEAAMDALAADCEAKCAERVKMMKVRTIANDQRIDELLAPTETDTENLGAREESEINAIMEHLEETIESRQAEVAQFGEDLERVEAYRKEQMELHMRVLTKKMTEAAHEVHGVVERIIERESLKASELLLTNGVAQADVLARLKVSCLEKRKECKTRWHAGMVAWRRMRHHHAIDVCMARIQSREFRNPLRLVELFKGLRAEQRSVYDSRFSLAQRVIKVDIEQIRETEAKNLEDKINQLNEE